MEMNSEIQRSSEVTYKSLCEIVGDEEAVQFYRLCSKLSTSNASILSKQTTRNRTMEQIKRMFESNPNGWQSNQLLKHLGDLAEGDPRLNNLDVDYIDSGSRAEGFTFPSCDYDVMVVIKSWKLVQSLPQSNRADHPNVLLVDKRNTRPGFARLRAPAFEPSLFSSLNFKRYDHEYYLSNSIMTEMICRIANAAGYNLNQHGPCANTTSRVEYDIATTLSLDTWPDEAVGCIHRLFKRRWPSDDVIKAMVNDGCLFVPIGCKTSPHQGIEWRMSFSLAEKRLVHSMNHTQFLTYALLKLFLKEVVDQDPDIKGILCSYFMKTLVFWEIMETDVQWESSCLLQNAWNCFRRLLNWKNSEYCPNFFIPENNMFHGKFVGAIRQMLLRTLHSLYREGYLIFLQSPTMKRAVDNLGAEHRLSHTLRRSTAIHWFIYYVRQPQLTPIGDQKALQSTQSNICLEFSHYLRLNKLNIMLNKTLCSQFSQTCDNKMKYMKEKSMFRLIKGSSPDCVRSKIFLALYLYKCKRYDSCICLLQKVMRKLKSAETMYYWNFDSNKYFCLGGDEFSVVEGMYRYTVMYVPVDSETSIPEIPKGHSFYSDDSTHTLIPPLVLTYFLFVLCFFWKGNLSEARAQLKQLQQCCKHPSTHMPSYTFPLAWEILGVGQELIGDFRNALISYEVCLKCLQPTHRFLDDEFRDVCKVRIARIKAFLNMQ